MTIKWFKSPFNWVIFLLTQPQVADQQQQKKEETGCIGYPKVISTVFAFRCSQIQKPVEIHNTLQNLEKEINLLILFSFSKSSKAYFFCFIFLTIFSSRCIMSFGQLKQVLTTLHNKVVKYIGSIYRTSSRSC